MCEKRWVFRTDLNVAKDGMFLISIGREFQSTGADAEKARLPYVCILTGRTERRFCEDDLSGRAGVWWWISSVMYEGERLFSALKHIMRILNITRFSTGNQWGSYMYVVKFTGSSIKKKNLLQISQNILLVDGIRQNNSQWKTFRMNE